jgi:hypothetical protein
MSNEIETLKAIHNQEQQLRRQWKKLRDRRKTLIVTGKHIGISVAEMLSALRISQSRVYSILQKAEVEPVENMKKEAVLSEMGTVAANMEQKEKQAGTLAHQRNRLAVAIVDGGTTISSLSKQLNVNYEFLQFWLQDRPKDNY